MILVADSGSTKADWVLMPEDGERRYVDTRGFNPVVHPQDLLHHEVQKLSQDLLPNVKPSEVYYYGAGCWDYRRKKVVYDAIANAWPRAEITVMHDLLGAARATCGREAGIACILGTGSNTCLYDGTDVTDNVTNLGFMLGDEGSGSHLGKAFLRAYFYRELDDDLNAAFENFTTADRMTVLNTVYESEMPNTYLAGFTRFMGEHMDHPLIQKIVFSSFAEFLDRHVRKYSGHLELPVHFIGSIAFHFRTILLAALHERDLHAGRFVQKPIEALADFHTH
jgi:N-acetylglucosamine kinase-like BadF-type ATPase